MKFKNQLLQKGTAGLVVALFILQGFLLFQNHQATKEQVFLELEVLTKSTIAELDTIRVEQINSKFENDIINLGVVKLDSVITETGRKLIVRDAKENYNLVEVHFPKNPKTDEKTNLELLLMKNKEMLLEGSIMYWQETLGEKMNEYMKEPWNLQEVDSALVTKLTGRFSKLSVGLVENDTNRVWGKTMDQIINKRFRLNQSLTVGVNGLALEAFSRMKFFVFMSLLVFVLLILSFYLIIRSWSNELQVIKLKEEQLDHLAHEILTPLSIISIALDRIKVKSEGQIDLNKYLRIAKSEIKRMDILSRNILFKGLGGQAITINLLEFLNQYKDLQWEGLEIKSDFLLQSNYFIKMNKDSLELVIYSLLDNAVKYAEKIPVTVEFKIRETPEHIFLTIHDNGVGIKDEDKSKVFQKYYRSERAKLNGKRGFGLGLYHVSRILKETNAEISMKNVPVGAAFEIKFNRA
ncbi:sensor histidine kinase [Mongoliitalea lutea]|uniref:histidine kinase n=1 Tax=Mongoliitalea lutea TaxID=849756 RepID=A0A8J3G501_9BACT|nr:HAMP domain-containing sensor histidine kinase [Mongoliitalea lutea]GHB34919.1 hypothetical protein GCM10008106_15330 [Mongoliitalea lutea]